ncbi:uncharacterized protein LOC123292120 [Chrysoperla carnea]|uniref:uncharacterized protein LOC123292120 n=1 Tax=Chrysoperla carnea TaxID=189513 RepID=UPI001D085A14|nr:uncharacterized protein LOC123292120 [Chrysoperla carnea]
MTMSVPNSIINSDIQTSSSESNSSPVTSLPSKNTTKRSFDVAFLISQDDHVKPKKSIRNYEEHEIKSTYQHRLSTISPIPHVTTPRLYNVSPPLKQIFDDPRVPRITTVPEQRSAFTKVKLDSTPQSSPQHAPSQSNSPDLNYQHSLSPSPPIIYSPKLPTNTPVFHPNTIPIPYRNNVFIEQSNYELFQAQKLRNSTQVYQPTRVSGPSSSDMSPYAFHPQHFPQPNDLIKFPTSPSTTTPTPTVATDLMKLQANPAAAILNSLLPPTFAALSLPAQNVCAKCNISFRMTSDLVYHMRSHHKNEMSNDSLKKRREDKLKCPVCSESFRERHHLTRHMTAHQDKEGDGIEDPTLPITSSTLPARKARNSSSSVHHQTTNSTYNNVFCK